MAGTSDITDLIPDIQAKLQEAYDRGRLDGRLEERERIEKLLRSDDAAIGLRVVTMPRVAGSPAAPGLRGPGNRVAAGTIRPLVREVLTRTPGLPKAEIARRVAEMKPEVAPSSIANELQRNAGAEGQRLYRRRRDRWYLQEQAELPSEMEGPAVAEDDRPAGSTLNGSYHHGGSIAPSGPAE